MVWVVSGRNETKRPFSRKSTVLDAGSGLMSNLPERHNYAGGRHSPRLLPITLT